MFWNNPIDTLLKLLIEKFEQSYVWIRNEIPISAGNTFEYHLHWYTIRFSYSTIYLTISNYSLMRGEEYICKIWDERYKWFFEKIWSIVRKDEAKYKTKLEEELKIKKEIEDEVLIGKINNWIEELNWIIVQKPSQEFSEVFEDKKRLDEISEEARKIHKKYQTWFNKLF